MVCEDFERCPYLSPRSVESYLTGRSVGSHEMKKECCFFKCIGSQKILQNSWQGKTWKISPDA